MASVKFEENSREFCMFQDYWRLLKEYWVPENSDAYWEELITAADQFVKKYGNERFPRDLALALISELERKVKIDKQI